MQRRIDNGEMQMQYSRSFNEYGVFVSVDWDKTDAHERVVDIETDEILHEARFPLSRLLADGEKHLDHSCSHVCGVKGS